MKQLLKKLMGENPWRELTNVEIALLIITHPFYCLSFWLTFKIEYLKKFINKL